LRKVLNTQRRCKSMEQKRARWRDEKYTLTCSISGALMTTLANKLFLFLVMYWNKVT